MSSVYLNHEMESFLRLLSRLVLRETRTTHRKSKQKSNKATHEEKDILTKIALCSTEDHLTSTAMQE